MTNGFTPTEERILAILGDGLRHTREELRSALWDELGDSRNVRFHITMLRRKLSPKGEGIVCEYYHKRYYYRQVRFISMDD